MDGLSFMSVEVKTTASMGLLPTASRSPSRLLLQLAETRFRTLNGAWKGSKTQVGRQVERYLSHRGPLMEGCLAGYTMRLERLILHLSRPMARTTSRTVCTVIPIGANVFLVLQDGRMR